MSVTVTHAIEGMKDESDSLLAFLFDHIAKPDFRYATNGKLASLDLGQLRSATKHVSTITRTTPPHAAMLIEGTVSY